MLTSFTDFKLLLTGSEKNSDLCHIEFICYSDKCLWMARLTPFTIFDVFKAAMCEFSPCVQGFCKKALRIQKIEEGCETL